MPLSDEQRQQMALYVRSYILRSAENFGHHNAESRASARWTHSLNVVKNATLIMNGEMLDDTTRSAVEVAALFHDIDHYTVQLEYHAARGAETARRWLLKAGYDAAFAKRVEVMIRNHHTDLADDLPVEEQIAEIISTVNFETRILMDADTLDKIGVNNILQSVMTMTHNGQKLADIAQELASGWPLQRASLWRQLLTTKTGQALGEERYQFYEAFLQQIATEIAFVDPYPMLTTTQEFTLAQLQPKKA